MLYKFFITLDVVSFTLAAVIDAFVRVHVANPVLWYQCWILILSHHPPFVALTALHISALKERGMIFQVYLSDLVHCAL